MEPVSNPEFSLSLLDHVALHVADPERAAARYEKVLGLRPYKLPEWGPFPVFTLAGKPG